MGWEGVAPLLLESLSIPFPEEGLPYPVELVRTFRGCRDLYADPDLRLFFTPAVRALAAARLQYLGHDYVGSARGQLGTVYLKISFNAFLHLFSQPFHIFDDYFGHRTACCSDMIIIARLRQ